MTNYNSTTLNLEAFYPMMQTLQIRHKRVCVILLHMPSSESLRCTICGQQFDTIESLQEHQASENEEQELRNKGITD
jgi:predicted GTPase